MDLTWQLSRHKNIHLLEVGNLLSEHINKEVLTEVDACLRKGFTNYVVDMSGVTYINSIGLNLLIQLKERARKKGGKLVLTRLSHNVVKLLEMTKLSPLFECADTLEAAFAAFPEQKN